MAEASALTSNLRGLRPGEYSDRPIKNQPTNDYLVDQLEDAVLKSDLAKDPAEKSYYDRIIDQLQKRIAQIQMFDTGLKGIDINEKRADQLSSAEVSDLATDPKKLAEYFQARFEAVGKDPLTIKDEFMAFLKAAPKIAKNPDFLIAVGKTPAAVASGVSAFILPYAYAMKYKKYALIASIVLGIILGLVIWIVVEFWKEDKLALIQEMINEPECENVGNFLIGQETDMDRCVITLLGNRIKSRVEVLEEE